ncbi:MAG: MFS transporter [Angustibacter sp.]
MTLPVSPAAERRQQRVWYVYDWASSGFFTTVIAVLIGPYLTAIAVADACPDLSSGQKCRTDLAVLGIPVDPGSLVSYVITLSTVLTALVLPLLGALLDRLRRPRLMLGAMAWLGSGAACSLWWVTGTAWRLGALAVLIATFCFSMSQLIYNALLIQVARPEERDAVSARGWALGYLSGFLLLGANLGLINGHAALGISTGTAVRLCFALAGIWWAVFSLVPVLGLADRPRGQRPRREPGGPGPSPLAVGALLRELRDTFRELRRSPQTLRFLIAYFIYNDGIQTVIVASSIYGALELGLETGTLVLSMVLVQLVALFGALLFGSLAQRFAAQRIILAGLAAWVLIVVLGCALPAGRPDLWFGLAAGVGLVLGGTQALSRSVFSRLIPPGREGQYFSFYQAGERGTSWTGTLLFGVLHQLTDSYRPSLIALAIFFITGGLLLRRVRLPSVHPEPIPGPVFTDPPHPPGTRTHP